ncbi:uncharacterized protein BBA_04409 [Beauveria bassiana ARSEF 2860]|uniref:Uncharacterized protein n=1 Tax=Beauveria bassiana (strain ARSEF 2860) TaxID=655819 RepID=J4KNX6_BEAB2|nr:uncharacterized protein BBA_04409 [Beauveria bassiana ARSEF 2860]EJP66469.1 hypothetical protein BBA_04409 [Beauveria bassiana ARSEF 2860]
MNFHSYIMFTISIFAWKSCAASLATIQRRESGTRCNAYDPCVNYYTTGSAQCASGYERSVLEAKHSPLGSYCERPCTANERKQCSAKMCSTSECKTYPANGGLCRTALRSCGGTAKMDESICNWDKMAQPVIYDRQSGLCSVDKTVRQRSESYTTTAEIQYRFRADNARGDTVDMLFTCAGIEEMEIDAFRRSSPGKDCHKVGYLAFFCDESLKGSVEGTRQFTTQFCQQLGGSYTFGPMPQK